MALRLSMTCCCGKRIARSTSPVLFPTLVISPEGFRDLCNPERMYRYQHLIELASRNIFWILLNADFVQFLPNFSVFAHLPLG